MAITSWVVAALIALLSIQPVMNLFDPTQRMNASFDPLSLVNTYGAFGTAAVLLLWLYVEARLAVGAAFLNAVVHRRRTSEAVQE